MSEYCNVCEDTFDNGYNQALVEVEKMILEHFEKYKDYIFKEHRTKKLYNLPERTAIEFHFLHNTFKSDLFKELQKLKRDGK